MSLSAAISMVVSEVTYRVLSRTLKGWEPLIFRLPHSPFWYESYEYGGEDVRLVSLFVVCFPGVTTHCGCIFTARWRAFASSFFRGFLITHNDAQQSVGLLWTSDQSVAETSTWQHTTLATDKHPRPRWDSNPQSQQASGWRPTP